jgi:adenylosuccinate lyase
MNNAALTALSPLDGRYAARLGPLRDLLSEAAFMRFRVQVEMAWLVALSDAGLPELSPFSADSRRFLAEMLDSFGTEQAARIKQIEEKTNHDVKAVEYFLKESVAGQPQLLAAAEFIHFACTSEDINNTSHGLMLGRARRRCAAARCAQGHRSAA